MSLQVEKLEKNMAKLTIEVSAEDLEKAMQAASPSIQDGYAVAFLPSRNPREAKTVGAAQIAATLPPFL